jgi:hypothetical protein
MFDTFSTDHAGSAEGGNMYGWGLYFSKRKDSADTYRIWKGDRNNGGSTEFRIDGKTFEQCVWLNRHVSLSWLESFVAEPIGSGRARGADPINSTAEENIKSLQSRSEVGSPKYTVLDRLARLVRDGKVSARHNGKGVLFTVSLPDGPYLDWDKPASEQLLTVTNACESILGDLAGYEFGWSLYSAICKKYRSPSGKAASEALKNAGVIGSTHLSRSGNREFVIYDASKITLISREGPEWRS